MIMSPREVGLEEILGRVVRTAAGRPVGRIDDIGVEPEGDEYLVRSVLIGELGLSSRLLRFFEQLPTFRALRRLRRPRQRRIPWDWLDFSDPHAPRFRGSRQGKERQDG
jgi:hypothetical protein